jgi:hypothetical protein
VNIDMIFMSEIRISLLVRDVERNTGGAGPARGVRSTSDQEAEVYAGMRR